ncbi:hypothetical protein HB364_26100 [Pseudoflavitalea sp. X16]|uniref:hypothetical protein n=1 Tax=Paraflavitalea devenefica TaxID=2716334 RepID=UPI00141ED32C|nr:hypothetical protein [Paraflavitalea devenefica]NII28583.1 hypothetical protein [Paraflavitalea devenefica]
MKLVNLIGANKSKIGLICIAFLGLCCSITQKKPYAENTFLMVDFQDHFNNDIVGLKFNNCIVFSGEHITTKFPVGFANFRVRFLKERKNKYRVLYSDKMIVCKSREKVLKLVVQLNDSEHEFFIDLGKGKYIGFSKKNKKELYFFQKNKPFVYE